jgi:hypothetical protein
MDSNMHGHGSRLRNGAFSKFWGNMLGDTFDLSEVADHHDGIHNNHDELNFVVDRKPHNLSKHENKGNNLEYSQVFKLSLLLHFIFVAFIVLFFLR